jgi:tellurite resistance protein TehA-like permease
MSVAKVEADVSYEHPSLHAYIIWIYDNIIYICTLLNMYNYKISKTNTHTVRHNI